MDQNIDLTVGQTFTKTRENYETGTRVDETMTATVLGIITDFIDPWTGDRHETGVSFSIENPATGRVSRHRLDLNSFLVAWDNTI